MKIGIDCRLWSETGVGRYTRNLVEQLLTIDRKNEYILFVLSKDKENIKYQISNIKKNWKFKIGNWKLRPADVRWHTFEEQIGFPQILNQENLDLVHFPYFSVPIFYNRPFVVTIHDLIMHHFPTGQASTHSSLIYRMKLLGYKYVISQAAKKARKIIAVSNATKHEIIDHLKINPQKVVVTHEGADDKISNPKSQVPNKLQITNYKLQNSKYFLYVGNAYPHKNLDRLLESFSTFCHSELVSESRNVELVFVGKNDYFYNRLKKKTERMGLSEKVIFLQNVGNGELSNLYKNALAFVTPSLMEGFGLPALEAMASKCLVLASNIPALKEVCADSAIYFDPYNIEDIAEKMSEIHSNNTYHYSDLIKRGYERAKDFSWRKMAEETLAVYEGVA